MRAIHASELLAGTAIFRGASKDEFVGLDATTYRRRFAKGDYLFHDGDSAEAMWVIVEGEVQVSRVGPRGEDFVLESYFAGDALGQLPLFDAAPVRVMDAKAATATECLVVRRDALVAHLAAHPRLLLLMVGTYSRWIRQRDLNASEMAFQNLTGKVACKLLELLHLHDESTGGQAVGIGLDLRQHELAAMVGGSRENVNRALQRLLKDGEVRRDGRRWSVTDPARLRERYTWSAPAEWVVSRSFDRQTQPAAPVAPAHVRGPGPIRHPIPKMSSQIRPSSGIP